MNASENKSIDLNPEASLFYSNLAKIIKATTIPSMMTRSAINYEMNNTAEFYLENDLEYPMQAKLATIEIETENGDIISYFDLPEEEQVVFVDMYTQHEAQLLSERLSEIPELEQYIGAQNLIITEALEEEFIDTRSGQPQIDDPKAFFSKLSAKLDAMASSFVYDSNPAETKGLDMCIYDSRQYEVEFATARRLMANKAKRGDIIVALPCHDYPKCVINFSNAQYKVGHAEIFIKDITSTTSKSEAVTIGAWTSEGVSQQTLSNWCWRSYVVGVCSYKVQWRWRGFKSGFYPVQTPVSNPGLMANWARRYEGKSYVKWYEFLTAKWAAPERFTCTSLVWWCAKNAYNERISPWYSTLVTPSDVLCDNNTYLKVTIE